MAEQLFFVILVALYVHIHSSQELSDHHRLLPILRLLVEVLDQRNNLFTHVEAAADVTTQQHHACIALLQQMHQQTRLAVAGALREDEVVTEEVRILKNLLQIIFQAIARVAIFIEEVCRRSGQLIRRLNYCCAFVGI